MKKSMKLMALVMALMLVFVSFAGCGKTETAPSGSDGETAKVAKAANPEDSVKGFFDAFADADFAGAAEFLSEDSESRKQVLELEEKLESELTDSLGALSVEKEDITPLMKALFSKITYEIKDTKVDGDKAEVAFALIAPADFNALVDDATADLDFEAVMLDFLKSEGYDPETFDEESADWTEEQQNELLSKMVPYLLDILTDSINEANDFEKSTEEIALNLAKDGDKWVIVELDDKIMDIAE